MRSLLWSIFFGFLFSLVLVLAFFWGRGVVGYAAFWLLLPVMRLVGALLAARLPVYDSGAQNTILLLLVSFPVGGILFSAVFFAMFKVIAVARRAGAHQARTTANR